jgi:dihydroflavonol-4-reductase
VTAPLILKLAWSTALFGVGLVVYERLASRGPGSLLCSLHDAARPGTISSALASTRRWQGHNESENVEHGEMDRRAIACFDQALADVGVANDSVLGQVLYGYFAWATTTTMSRYNRSEATMEGVRYVLHVASPIPSTTPKNPDDLIVPAREGTLNVMRAASRARVRRVVQTSSATAICYGRDDPNSHLFTEDDWTNPDHKDNVPYTRSKTIAERAAWAELRKLPRQLEWVAINPGLVLGPVLDKDSSASVLIVAKLLNGEIPGLPRFGYCVVDVRDLADLEIRAMTAPQVAGQRFIGSGPFISMSEIANVLKERLGDMAKKVPNRKLPDWVVRLVGLFDSEVRGQVFELGKVRRLSSAKAEKDLGWSFRPWEETIVDTATSLEAVGAFS